MSNRSLRMKNLTHFVGNENFTVLLLLHVTSWCSGCESVHSGRQVPIF